MRSLLVLIIAFFLIITNIFSQGIEFYGGYFNRLKPQNGDNQVRNFNNGNAGINGTIYIRSVAIRMGIGYMSDHYRIDYKYHSNPNDEVSSNVSNFYIYAPLMIYPKLYADGKNILSVGAGAIFMFPRVKPSAHINYEDGTSKQARTGRFLRMIAPRVSVRYTRIFAQSFLFFTDLHTDITPMESFRQESPGFGGQNPSPFIPSYWSWAGLGLNVGFGYIFPSKGVKMPRYFYKNVKAKLKAADLTKKAS